MWPLCILFTLFLVLHPTRITAGTMDSKALSASIGHFSAKFCNELEKSKNVVASPLSAEFVLALLALGTTDPAHAELLKALHLPSDKVIRSSFSELSSQLKALKGVTLKIANKVYIQEGPYDLQSEIKTDAVKVFNAALEKIDFGGADAADQINSWVAAQTNDKIKDLLSSDSVSSDTRLVLVNALYFKGQWKAQFDPAHTHQQDFYVTASSTVQVPMMYREDDYFYGESEHLEAQLLQLHYVGGQASLLVVLPHEIEGLNSVIEKLAGGYNLLNDVATMHKMKVQVSLPKFKIETEIDLNDLLPKLGVQSIFNRNNSGLTKLLNATEPLFVSKAVQKVFIEVNEEGAEAAAATGMVIMMRCARLPSPRFRADRPFFYMLLGADQTPLFAGTFHAAE